MSNAPIEENARSARVRAVIADAAQYGTITPLDSFHFQVTQAGRRTNHILHLLLTLLTFGAWAMVWFVLWFFLSKDEERHVVSVDESGRVWVDGQLRTRGLGLK